MNQLSKLTTASLATLLLAACSPMVATTDSVDYKSAKAGNPLETPPDLTRISASTRYAIPAGGTASANAYNATRQVDTAGAANHSHVAADQVGDVRIERQGNQRWLVVSRTPGQLWNPVKTFWEDNGFVLSTDDPRVGVMETDWAENRAKLPLDFIRATLGKALDSLYSTGELDRFRTRFESNASGGTRIYLTHRGMREVLTGRDKSNTTWEQRPTDIALEDEMLRRMMVALGVSQQRAETILPKADNSPTAAAPAPQRAAPVKDGVLTIHSAPDTAWQRTALALDRSGFSVENRDAATHSFKVRYTPDISAATQVRKPGLLGRLVGKKAEVAAASYLLRITPAGNGQSHAHIQTLDGHTMPQAEQHRILGLIARYLD